VSIRASRASLAVCVVVTAAGCATLGSLGALVQAPQFEQSPDRPAELRLLPPSAGNPYGGAGVRLWTRVTNPNAFSLTLSRLDGTLFLDEARAALVDLPLGLPLDARGETEFPMDLTVSLTDLPGLADALRRAGRGESIPYRLDGTIGVQAGRFGAPEFGPKTLLRGDVRVSRLPASSAPFSPPVFRQPQHRRQPGMDVVPGDGRLVVPGGR
jgi:hypothetical protein